MSWEILALFQLETNALEALTLKWSAPITLALWRYRQEEQELEASLGYMVRPSLSALP